MYITIGGRSTHAISDLQFAPEANVTGSTIPVDELSVRVKTARTINTGQFLHLYDDRDNLWAVYWIMEANRDNAQSVTIRAMSAVSALERKKMSAVMYNSEPIGDVLDAIFANTIVGVNHYTLDSSLSSITISGYCPKQSARDRLLWVCFVAKAYVRQSFTANGNVEIKAVSQSVEEYIPAERTRWKPTVEDSDYVSKLTIRAYSYTQITEPEAKDTWVKVGSRYYRVETTDYTRVNPAFPANLPENEVTIEDVQIVNTDNATGLLDYYEGIYFNPRAVSLDVINNYDYFPGQKVTVHTNEDEIVTGYIVATSFSFGLQSMSNIRVAMAEDAYGDKLTIEYVRGETVILTKEHFFPWGYDYTVENPYIDKVSADGERHVFYPLHETITGGMVEGGVREHEYVELALHFVKEMSLSGREERVLGIASVSELTLIEVPDGAVVPEPWVADEMKVISIG